MRNPLLAGALAALIALPVLVQGPALAQGPADTPVRSFGTGMPLETALRAIVPSGVPTRIEQGIGRTLSWSPGPSWRLTLSAALRPVGLVMDERAGTVVITTAEAVAERREAERAVAAAEPPATALAPAALPGSVIATDTAVVTSVPAVPPAPAAVPASAASAPPSAVEPRPAAVPVPPVRVDALPPPAPADAVVGAPLNVSVPPVPEHPARRAAGPAEAASGLMAPLTVILRDLVPAEVGVRYAEDVNAGINAALPSHNPRWDRRVAELMSLNGLEAVWADARELLVRRPGAAPALPAIDRRPGAGAGPWVARPGSTLRATLDSWAADAGWHVEWPRDKAHVRVPIDYGHSFEGSFADAVLDLVNAFATLTPAPYARIVSRTRVVKITIGDPSGS